MAQPVVVTPALTAVEVSSPTTVLVTGATGYIAGVLIQRLLAAGHTVHGTARDVDKASAELEVLPGAKQRLRLFKADLLKADGFKEAMQGCTVVFHTASPVVTAAFTGEQARINLVEPAVQGTINVLNAVNETPAVRRVVLTSSAAAIHHSALSKPPGYLFSEVDWNEQSSLFLLPYNYSKAQAEKKAWEIAGQQKRWDLVVINPVVVWGPAATVRSATSSASLQELLLILKGRYSSVVPPLGFGVVDVRDVAAAHTLTAFTPTANGRNLVAPTSTNVREMVTLASKLFPGQVKPPFWTFPKWLALLLGPWLGVGRDVIRARFNSYPHYNSGKAERELGIRFLPVEDTLRDTAATLQQWGVSPFAR